MKLRENMEGSRRAKKAENLGERQMREVDGEYRGKQVREIG